MTQNQLGRRSCIQYLFYLTNNWLGPFIVTLCTLMYIGGFPFSRLPGIIVIDDVPQPLPELRYDFGLRPALLIPVVVSLFVLSFSSKDNPRNRIGPIALLLWSVCGTLACLIVTRDQFSLRNTNIPLFSVLLANSLFFSYLLCGMNIELSLLKRLRQYTSWLFVFAILYFSIWIPPVISISLVRWFACLSFVVVLALKNGRSFINRNEDLKYLTLMTFFHSAIMILSHQETL